MQEPSRRRYREAKGDTEKQKGIQRSKGRHREAESDTEKQTGIQRSKRRHREADNGCASKFQSVAIFHNFPY